MECPFYDSRNIFPVKNPSLIQMVQNDFGHPLSIHFLHAIFINISGTVSIFQSIVHRFFNGIGGSVFTEGVAEHHGCGKDGGNGVDNSICDSFYILFFLFSALGDGIIPFSGYTYPINP